LSHDEFVLDEQKTIYCTEDWAKKKAYLIQIYPIISNSIQFDPILSNFLTPFSECFTCVACGKDLSHDEFVLDEQKTIYCTEDWAKKKAYRCVTCKRAIVPTEGQTKAPRLRALGKDYHPDCFKCEVCILDTIPIFF
jgi:hypothetical protein